MQRFFLNPDTGELTIFQAPNPPLWIFFAAALTKRVADPAGTTGTVLAVVSGVALAWWSIDELVRGDSPFRRLLGAVVLAGLVVGFVT
ncbi:MAG TPA: hypothetical protein VM030_08545 [Acidimicrobiales bacterium]|nr:hypothetical protein [Acidimicrobiales bacterium]